MTSISSCSLSTKPTTPVSTESTTPVSTESTIPLSAKPTISSSTDPTISSSTESTISASKNPTTPASTNPTISASKNPTISSSTDPTTPPSAKLTISSSAKPTISSSTDPTVSSSTKSQALYKAVVISSKSLRSTGRIIGQVSSSRNIEELANSIYPLIKPPGDPSPEITIPLGTTSLINFSQSIKSKGVSVQFYEFSTSTSSGGFKNPWIPISASSVQPGNKSYAMALGKSGYSATTEIPFRMFSDNDNVSMLKFDREETSLEDWIRIFFYVDPGASGDQNTVMQLVKTLRKKDSRLRPIVQSTCADIPPQMQQGCDPLKYIIRLSR